ncbi:MAG: hypothetical protein J6Q22_16990 [Prevotella sp.]|nr:hypothetical protein [Prevotella sp.]
MKKMLLIGAWLLSAATAMFAVEYPLWVANVQVTDDNKSDVLGDGTTVVSVRKTTITLMFNNANIDVSGAGKYAVRFDADDSYKTLNISCQGTNSFTSNSASAFQFANGGTVEIGGEGATMNIQPRNHAFYMAGTGKISIGMGGEPLTLNVTPLSNTRLSPFASGSSDNVQLEFYNINADIQAPASQTIMTADNGFTSVIIAGGITLQPEGVAWDNTARQFMLGGEALTEGLQMVAPAPEMQYEISAACDPEQGTATASGMTTFTESQIYHMSGDDIMFETLNFDLTATPAAHFKFLGWVDVTNMVDTDDENLNTPEKVIAAMKAALPDLQYTDPKYSVYGALLNANAAFDAETFYNYLFLYEPEDGHITFTAFFVQDTQGIEDVQGDKVQSTKECHDGVLYIVRDGKIYNATGEQVK